MTHEDGQDREWRGRPVVPVFRFDRRSAPQRAGDARLPLVVLGALVAYLAVEPALTRVAGGLWGELATLVLVGAPLGAAWAVAQSGVSAIRAWKTGALFAFASAALYAWIFTAAWV